MEIITRQDAIALGKERYYTGRPCKNGHDTFRYSLSGTCSGCLRAHARKKYDEAALFLLNRREARRESHEVVKFRVPFDMAEPLKALVEGVLVPSWWRGKLLDGAAVMGVQALLDGDPQPQEPVDWTEGLHPDDVATINAIVQARRLMSVPPLPVAPIPPSVPSAPPATTYERELQTRLASITVPIWGGDPVAFERAQTAYMNARERVERDMRLAAMHVPGGQ